MRRIVLVTKDVERSPVSRYEPDAVGKLKRVHERHEEFFECERHDAMAIARITKSIEESFDDVRAEAALGEYNRLVGEYLIAHLQAKLSDKWFEAAKTYDDAFMTQAVIEVAEAVEAIKVDRYAALARAYHLDRVDVNLREDGTAVVSVPAPKGHRTEHVFSSVELGE